MVHLKRRVDNRHPNRPAPHKLFPGCVATNYRVVPLVRHERVVGNERPLLQAIQFSKLHVRPARQQLHGFQLPPGWHPERCHQRAYAKLNQHTLGVEQPHSAARRLEPPQAPLRKMDMSERVSHR